MTEKTIERKFRELIRKRGGMSRKFVSPGNAGVPDRIVITPSGEVWFVELKTINGKLTPLQKQEIAKLEQQGANVRALHGWDEAKNFIEEVMPSGI